MSEQKMREATDEELIDLFDSVDGPDRTVAGLRAVYNAALATRAAPAVPEALISALHDAATSLESISSLAGRKTYGEPPIETFMNSFADIRAYAAARASVAREALLAAQEHKS